MRTLGSLVFVTLVGACASKSAATADDEGTLLAQDGSDVNALEGNTESMTSTFVTGTASGLGFATASELTGGALAAQGIGDGLRLVYLACKTPLTVTQDTTAKTVSYAFDDCTGPYGLLHVTGTVQVKYAQPAANELDLDISATGLKVNRVTIDWSAKAVVTLAGAARSMTWDGKIDGATARGRAFARTNHKQIGWEVGKQCVSVSGTSEGDTGGRKLRTEVTALSMCRGACPDAGGSIKVTNLANGKTVSLDFDGTDTATYTSPNGTQAAVKLPCSS